MSFGAGSKKPAPQEMVQVDSTGRSGSPFWKSKSSTTQRSSSKGREADHSGPIGAAYSHADLLKLDELSLAPSSRPRTPPRLSRHGSNQSVSPDRSRLTSRTRGSPAPAPKPATRATRSWSLATEENENRDAEALMDDEEDEFGLPSLATSRRALRRAGGPSLELRASERPDLGINPSLLEPSSSGSGRGRADSTDIAEERGAVEYPSARKSEGKILRPQYKEILRDPMNALQLIQHPSPPRNATAKEVEAVATRISRINRFKRILQNSSISLSELRDAAWSGVPGEVRSISWQVLLGYLPTGADRRVATLERKRREYLDGIKQVFERGNLGIVSPVAGRMKSAYSPGRARGLDETVWHQISIDVPRTSPHIELYGFEATQRSLERILYLWAIRHPASGYVQGINDLVTPFWQVFLGSYITDPDIESGMDPGQLPRPVLDAVEADSYWCLTKLLDGIQDNYIYAQPGIVRQVSGLRDLTHRIDKTLARHLEREGVEFMQFSFRWMNCLLMREVNVGCTIRMWDTYMAEEQGFSHFHLYVCAAFLVKWTDQLVKMEFQEIMMFLQALPTKDWGEKEVELLLSEAFIWQSLFRGSSAHLKNSTDNSQPAI